MLPEQATTSTADRPRIARNLTPARMMPPRLARQAGGVEPGHPPQAGISASPAARAIATIATAATSPRNRFRRVATIARATKTATHSMPTWKDVTSSSTDDDHAVAALGLDWDGARATTARCQIIDPDAKER